jgi:flagellar basal body rod protein FlgG
MISVTQTGLNATQKELNVLSNNLANASTVGFKRSYTNFGDIFSNDPASNPKTSIGMGITTQAVARDTAQGALKSTSNVTDLAIDGQGYFVLSTNLPTEPPVVKTPAALPSFNGNGLVQAQSVQPPPTPTAIPPFNGDVLKTSDKPPLSASLRLFNVNSSGQYEGPDDGYKVFVDGSLIASYSAKDPAHFHQIQGAPEIDLAPYINPNGSNIKIEFYNADTLWDWGYSLTINGKNIKAETSVPNIYQTSGPLNADKLTKTVDIQIPNLSSSDNRQAFDWKTAFNLSNKTNVFLAKVGVAGGQITEPRTGFPYMFDNSKNGFSGRDPYISFGDENSSPYSDTENRSVALPAMDLTSINKMTFDAIRGNGMNGGSTPNSVGDEFGVFYSIDGGLTYKEINSRDSNYLETLSNTSSVFNDWYGVTIDIPAEARTKNTIIKFKQEISTTPQTNLWGISNIDFKSFAAEPAKISQIYSADTIFSQSGRLYMTISGEGSGFGNNTGFIGREKYLNFGGDQSNASNVVRALDFRLDLTGFDTFKFDTIHGNGLNGGKQPTSEENLGVYYSLDNGTTFKEISTGTVNFAWPNIYPSTSTLSGADPKYNSWNDASFTIPEEARGNNTIIRFAHKIQNSSNDNLWGVSNITLGTSLTVQNSTTQANSFLWNNGTLSGSFQNVYQRTAGTGIGIDGFTGRSNYISFGNGGAASTRYLSLDGLDLSQKSSINFDLIKGTNNNGGELPDFGEGLTLEYSTDGMNYNTLLTIPSNDSNLSSWATKTINLPADAQTNSTKIRFRQDLSSGGKLDQWGLANISFNNVTYDEPLSSGITTEPKYDWSYNNISGSARNVFKASAGAGANTNDGFSGRNSYVIFGGDGSAGERYLTYNSLDLSMKQNISFDIIRGNGTNGGDSPNISAESLSLLYSIDNGVTFKTLKSYSFNDPALTNWMADSIALPKEAQTESTILKFYQPQSSGASYDHWGLSNIAFTDTPTKPEVVPQLVYSRAGNFGVDKDGYIVNPSGFKLMGTDIKTGTANKAVRIPSSDLITKQPLQAVSISNKGVVSATYGAGPSIDLYRISIATFASDAGLKPLGNVAFAQTGASGAAKISNAGENGGGNIMAGTLEQANVDITNELMAMIAAQQIYNGNARMLQTQIEALKRLTDNI